MFLFPWQEVKVIVFQAEKTDEMASEPLRTYDLYLNGQDPLNICALPARCDEIPSLKSWVSPSSLSALKRQKKTAFHPVCQRSPPVLGA